MTNGVYFYRVIIMDHSGDSQPVHLDANGVRRKVTVVPIQRQLYEFQVWFVQLHPTEPSVDCQYLVPCCAFPEGVHRLEPAVTLISAEELVTQDALFVLHRSMTSLQCVYDLHVGCFDETDVFRQATELIYVASLHMAFSYHSTFGSDTTNPIYKQLCVFGRCIEHCQVLLRASEVHDVLDEALACSFMTLQSKDQPSKIVEDSCFLLSLCGLSSLASITPSEISGIQCVGHQLLTSSEQFENATHAVQRVRQRIEDPTDRSRCVCLLNLAFLFGLGSIQSITQFRYAFVQEETTCCSCDASIHAEQILQERALPCINGCGCLCAVCIGACSKCEEQRTSECYEKLRSQLSTLRATTTAMQAMRDDYKTQLDAQERRADRSECSLLAHDAKMKSLDEALQAQLKAGKKSAKDASKEHKRRLETTQRQQIVERRQFLAKLYQLHRTNWRRLGFRLVVKSWSQINFQTGLQIRSRLSWHRMSELVAARSRRVHNIRTLHAEVRRTKEEFARLRRDTSSAMKEFGATITRDAEQLVNYCLSQEASKSSEESKEHKRCADTWKEKHAVMYGECNSLRLAYSNLLARITAVSSPAVS